jgi:hypothetical protein
MLQTTFKPAPLGEKQWKDLQDLEPHKVCRRAVVNFDREQDCYTITFIGREYCFFVNEKRVEGPDGEHDSLAGDDEFILLILTYLLSAQELPLVGKWVSEKDLQGGSLFFKGPHVLPVQPVIQTCGKDPQKFLDCGIALGGTSVTEYGDAALTFQALPRIPVTCILWAEDDEFPARVSFLFDPSIESHLPLDVVLALVRSVVKLLVETAP